MKTDSPASVMEALGTIDDTLQLQQEEHAELAGYVKAGADALKKMHQSRTATLLEGDPKLSVSKAEALAMHAIYESDEYTAYKAKLQEFEQLEKTFDYLDTRRSIGQSILKTMREAEYGQSQGQHGTGRPDGRE
jgi:hypothetical protein